MTNSRIRPATDPWLNILPAELMTLEANLAACANGDDGSTHAPTTPIVIGGLSGLQVTGVTQVLYGGTLTTSSSTSTVTDPTLELMDGNWPELDPGNVYATKKRYQPCASARGVPSHVWTVRQENGGLQAFSPMFDLSDGKGFQVSRAYVRLRAHDTSTLTSLSVWFHVGATHTTLPAVMPCVRVLRVVPVGNAVPMTSQAAGADANGFVFVPIPSSAAAWTNGFQQQELVVPVDQNNVIDAGQYTYLVELVEEQGLTGYPWQLTWLPYYVVAATYNDPVITDSTHFAPLPGQWDDVTPGADLISGDIVLVKDQVDPSTNGFYQLPPNPGPWSRVNVPFSQGMVVPVALGTSTGGTFWQAASSITSWNPVSAGTPSSPNPMYFVPQSDNPFPQEGQNFFAHGILWQAVVATYSKIPDLRPD